MRKLLFAALLLASGILVNAQQEYQLSHNMFNSAAVNAGAAGIDNALCAQMIGRLQWLGWGDGAPRTYVLNANANLGMFGLPENLGTGLTLVQDEIGPYMSTGAKFSGNYQLDLSEGKLGLGIDLGVLSVGMNPQDLNPGQGDDPTLLGLVAATQTIRATTFTGGVGAFYKSNNLYFGASTSQLLENNTSFATAAVQLKRHYYITGGYETKPINGNIVLKPSVFIKTDVAVTTMDLAVIGEYQGLAWLGASYRTGDAVIALVGVNPIKAMKVGFSYDFTTSDIRTTSSAGTVEMFLRYCHIIETKTKKRQFVDPSLLQ